MSKNSTNKYKGVRKKAPGKYILDFIDHNRKRRQKIFHGTELEAYRSRNAILAKRDRIRAGIEAPPSIEKRKPTLKEVWKLFTNNRQQLVDSGSMKPSSLKRYSYVQKAISSYCSRLHNTSIDKISANDIINFKKYRIQLNVS